MFNAFFQANKDVFANIKVTAKWLATQLVKSIRSGLQLSWLKAFVLTNRSYV